MNLRKAFVRRVTERAVADILRCIAETPNRRTSPLPGDLKGSFDFWFDGGAGRFQTGYVEYTLDNGARATVGEPVPALSVSIDFADGTRVSVLQA